MFNLSIFPNTPCKVVRAFSMLNLLALLRLNFNDDFKMV
jgi:hypothetical protein